MGLKELRDNKEMLYAISQKLTPLSENVFAAAIATFVNMWCLEHDEPHEKGMEILDNILAVRDDVEEVLKEEKAWIRY